MKANTGFDMESAQPKCVLERIILQTRKFHGRKISRFRGVGSLRGNLNQFYPARAICHKATKKSVYFPASKILCFTVCLRVRNSGIMYLPPPYD